MISIKRGEIHLAALDPTLSRKIAKTRPVVVISNDISNQYSGTITVLPITSQNLANIYPFEVKLKKGTANLSKASKVKTDQIRSIDKRRIVKRIGVLDAENIFSIERALQIHLDLSIEGY
jgi:mRNA interferase MazF